jgi:hypothetical protein
VVSEVLWCDGMGLRQRLKEVGDAAERTDLAASR